MSALCQTPRDNFHIQRPRHRLHLVHFEFSRQGNLGLPLSPLDEQLEWPLSEFQSAFATTSVCCSDSPVTLRPGRARFSTNAVPRGSTATANTIGMTDVACFAAGTPAPVVTMTSTFSLTNSAAISLYNSTRPSAQRPSTAMLRPSIHESSCNRCRKAKSHSEAVLVPSSDHWQLAQQLRPRRHRRRRRAAELRDEVAAPNAIVIWIPPRPDGLPKDSTLVSPCPTSHLAPQATGIRCTASVLGTMREDTQCVRSGLKSASRFDERG